MKLLNMIKEKLEQVDNKNLYKKMGYNSKLKYDKTLNTFLETKELHSWLSNGYYDFVHTSSTFLKKLCKELYIDSQVYNLAINIAVSKNEELKKIENCYIFVNTNFKRKNEPIFVLFFMENKRRLSFEKENLIFNDINNVLNVISETVKTHYKNNNSNLAIWGKIESYVYHHGDIEYI